MKGNEAGLVEAEHKGANEGHVLGTWEGGRGEGEGGGEEGTDEGAEDEEAGFESGHDDGQGDLVEDAHQVHALGDGGGGGRGGRGGGTCSFMGAGPSQRSCASRLGRRTSVSITCSGWADQNVVLPPQGPTRTRRPG